MAIPEQIGPYQIIETLGIGGMATVYKAYQPKLDRHVAIKVMHSQLMVDNQFINRFEREARIIARLDHPGIVPIYDYDEYEGSPYIVMKILPGTTLKDILEERIPTLGEIRQMMRGVAEALTYAHEHGILHRDIKPSNIIIDEKGQAYLTDFGLARIIRQGESTLSVDSMIGTPQYISPEQAQGLPDIDAYADIYSLGVVLYELMTGRIPFVADTPYAIIHKHIHMAPPLPSELNPEIPPAVEGVLLRALAKTPEDRYETPLELVTAFEEAIQQTGLKQLDDSRVDVAVERGADISEKTPGGKKYISIPSPIGNIEINQETIDNVVSDVGGRFRDAWVDIRQTLEDKGVMDKINSGVAKFTDKVSVTRLSNEDKAARERIRKENEIQKDWGTDETSVRSRVTHLIRERRGFFVHFAVYVVAMSAVYAVQPALADGFGRLFSDPGFQAEIGVDYLAPLADFNLFAVFALLWGSAVISHALGMVYNTGSNVKRRRKAMLNSLEAYYGPYWEEHVSLKDYRRIRNKTEERFNKRLGFVQHFAGAVMFSAAVLVAWPPIYEVLLNVSDISGSPLLDSQNIVPAIILLLMALTVILHGVATFLGILVGEEARERTLRREIQLERQRSGIYDRPIVEKPKNQLAEPVPGETPRIRLTEDGEFTPSLVEELNQQGQS